MTDGNHRNQELRHKTEAAPDVDRGSAGAEPAGGVLFGRRRRRGSQRGHLPCRGVWRRARCRAVRRRRGPRQLRQCRHACGFHDLCQPHLRRGAHGRRGAHARGGRRLRARGVGGGVGGGLGGRGSGR
ncbi:MAG: hypothetical protein F4X30_04490 [Acidimicrobiaceae bacterium]|nr:hypothetical protein [Acidimicrobiaceae bacterium]